MPGLTCSSPIFFAAQPAKHASRRNTRSLFLPPAYSQNPFLTAGNRLEKKKAYQAQRAQYEKLLTKSRSAQFLSASINWSPWMIYLFGSKLVERWICPIPPSATLPGLVAFSIATTPFLSEIHEKIMKWWKRPPELVQFKEKLDDVSGDIQQRTLDEPAFQKKSNTMLRFLPKRWRRSGDEEQTAIQLGTALISRYPEQQSALKALLPKLRDDKEFTHKHLIPALNRLCAEADEATPLLSTSTKPSSLDSVINPMLNYMTQEHTLLNKHPDINQERQNYQTHLKRALPELIQYLKQDPA